MPISRIHHTETWNCNNLSGFVCSGRFLHCCGFCTNVLCWSTPSAGLSTRLFSSTHLNSSYFSAISHTVLWLSTIWFLSVIWPGLSWKSDAPLTEWKEVKLLCSVLLFTDPTDCHTDPTQWLHKLPINKSHLCYWIIRVLKELQTESTETSVLFCIVFSGKKMFIKELIVNLRSCSSCISNVNALLKIYLQYFIFTVYLDHIHFSS